MLSTIKRGIKPKRPNPLGDVFGINQVLDELKGHIDDVLAYKDKLEADHQKSMADMKNEHDLEMARLRRLQFINKGDSGKDAQPINEEALAERVAKKVQEKIKIPEDGITPTVDYEYILKTLYQLLPKAENPELTAEKVFALLKKRKISVKHIGDFTDGMEQTLAPMRSLMAGFRGGGDTVAAGSGVTITQSNGVKTISASGGTPVFNEVVSGNTNTFTLANTPVAGTVAVYALGQRLVLTTDYSIVGKVITTVNSWLAGQIIADYQK